MCTSKPGLHANNSNIKSNPIALICPVKQHYFDFSGSISGVKIKECETSQYYGNIRAITEPNDTAGKVSIILNILINCFLKGHFLTGTKKIILSYFTEIELFQNHKTKIYHPLLFYKTGKNVTFQLSAYFFHHFILLHSADNQDVYEAIITKPAYVE